MKAAELNGIPMYKEHKRKEFSTQTRLGGEVCLGIIKQIIQMEHDKVKIPAGTRWSSWLLTSMAEDLNYCEQIHLALRVRLELRASRLQVHCSNHSAMLPPLNTVSQNQILITLPF